MKVWLGLLGYILLLGAATYIVTHRVREPEFPMVQSALPKHGFVCVPAITPRTGPVRSREIV